MTKGIKTTTLILGFIFVCSFVSASPVDRNTAKRKAAKYMSTKGELRFAADAGGEQPSYYIFNNAQTGKGFVIVSGDDSTDEILGYSDSGSFNPDSIPANLNWWLQCYDEQIKNIRTLPSNSRRKMLATVSEKTAIAPLVTTKWGQKAPYNGMIPMYDDAQSFPTGCAATAMAQILKYWSSEKETAEIPKWYVNTKDGRIEMPILPPTTFDYEKMKDTYDENDTGEAADEVAKLMFYCGQALKMDYRIYGSTAGVTSNDFKKAFNFSGEMEDLKRTLFSTSEWEEIIYNEIVNKRPVYYSGIGAEVGHAFICDGYDGKGLFHINWGWDGRFDGYFKLAELNPGIETNGMGRYPDGFNINQNITIGICPEATPSSPKKHILDICEFSLPTEIAVRSSENEDFVINFSFEVENNSRKSRNYDLGFAICDKDNSFIKIIPIDTNINIRYKQNIIKDVTLSLGQGILNETYTIKAIHKETGTLEWQYDTYSNMRYISVTIENNNITLNSFIDDESGFLKINNIDFEGKPTILSAITVKLNITNDCLQHKAISFVSPIYLFVNGYRISSIGVALDPGKSDDFLMHFTAFQKGKNIINITTDYQGKNIIYSTTLDISGTTDINLKHSEDNHATRIYSLDGKYIGVQKELQNLPSGIYFINKKKVIIP
ncbi:MAG: C10 family peptidase [Prevotella sp.]|nr:C10 family peptidase [Prevotella sp.]